MATRLVAAVLGTLLLTDATGSAARPQLEQAPASPISDNNGTWWRPPPGTSFQIQLSGALDLSHNVSMYDVDLFDTPAETIRELQGRGVRVICYFSAGTYEEWRPDKDQFTRELYGKALPAWKGEFYLDTRSPRVREIIEWRLTLARDKGCDGVDPDNVDGALADSGFALTLATQLDFNRFVARGAHERNLSVGLKNDLPQVPELVEDFDFAVNEECIEQGNCGDVRAFVERGKAVFGIEYKGDRDRGCELARELRFDTLYKSLDLKGERYSCDDAGEPASMSPSSSSSLGARVTPPTSARALWLMSILATASFVIAQIPDAL